MNREEAESLSISRFCDMGLQQCDDNNTAEETPEIVSIREDNLYRAVVERRRSMDGSIPTAKTTKQSGSDASSSSQSSQSERPGVLEKMSKSERFSNRRNSADNSFSDESTLPLAARRVSEDGASSPPVQLKRTGFLERLKNKASRRRSVDNSPFDSSPFDDSFNNLIFQPEDDAVNLDASSITTAGRRNSLDNSSLMPVRQQQKQKRRGSIERAVIDVQPGMNQPLRLALETKAALEKGFVRQGICASCEVPMSCIQDAKFMLCPLCRYITALDCEDKSAFGIGLGVVQHSLGVGLGVAED